MSRTDRIMRIRDYQPQDKFRDSRGREHYDNGRYAPRGYYDGYRDDYSRDYYDTPRRIGFSSDMPRMGDSMGYRGDYERGYSGVMYDGISRELADEWMRGLDNEDGSRGAHWSYEQTTNLLSQKKHDCDPIEFYVAMNMLYSDYYKVAKKFNVNNTEFYADLAAAFLYDKDAGDDKLMRYYECIVE